MNAVLLQVSQKIANAPVKPKSLDKLRQEYHQALRSSGKTVEQAIRLVMKKYPNK